MMSSINPKEEQSFLQAKKSSRTLYDERMTSLRTSGLLSAFDHLGPMHSETDFTPRPKQEKNKKAMSTSPSVTVSNMITMGTSSKVDRVKISMGMQRGGTILEL